MTEFEEGSKLEPIPYPHPQMLFYSSLCLHKSSTTTCNQITANLSSHFTFMKFITLIQTYIFIYTTDDGPNHPFCGAI